MRLAASGSRTQAAEAQRPDKEGGWPAGVGEASRRSGAMKDGLTCSGRDGELSAGGRRAVSGRCLVLHGALKLAGGVFVLGASIVGGIGSRALATRPHLFPKKGSPDPSHPSVSNCSHRKLEIDLLVDKYKNHAPTPIFKRVSPK